MLLGVHLVTAKPNFWLPGSFFSFAKLTLHVNALENNAKLPLFTVMVMLIESFGKYWFVCRPRQIQDFFAHRGIKDWKCYSKTNNNILL